MLGRVPTISQANPETPNPRAPRLRDFEPRAQLLTRLCRRAEKTSAFTSSGISHPVAEFLARRDAASHHVSSGRMAHNLDQLNATPFVNEVQKMPDVRVRRNAGRGVLTPNVCDNHRERTWGQKNEPAA